ncbi:MAG TPA: transcription termination/antitermination NusG family protein [Candidatus Acidoferrales bacterium]|jgi:transcriptional antiterminator NusG|nr:transcription termination/antitermination NusG family protein [Candidatus Acidoferrales bacterium]
MEPQPLPDSADTPWFALYVKPRHEKNVACILRGKGYDEFVPLYDRRTPSRTTELPLFPSYVFCRFDENRRLPVLNVPGVFSIVEFGGKLARVSEDEIAALKRVIAAGIARGPWPDLTPGAKVRIATGPLQGIEGVIVTHKNSTRLIVSVDLLKRSVAVELDRNWLEQPA